MKKNKIFLKILTIITIFIMFFGINTTRVLADVGYGSDWSDSSWDSGYDSSWDSGYDSSWDSGYDSSWDSGYDSSWDSDWDSDWDSSSSWDSDYSSSSSDLFLLIWLFGDSGMGGILILFIIIMIATRKSRNKMYRNARLNTRRHTGYPYKNRNGYNYNYVNSNSRNIYGPPTPIRPTYENPLNSITNEKALATEKQILAVDSLFSREEFEAWVKQIFIKLQYAWSDRKWEEIRAFETNELFEQHNMQLDRYIQKKQINVLEQVSVFWVKLYNFTQTEERDVLEVAVNSRMIDYVISEESGELLSGSKTDAKMRTYKLTFIRKKGIKTVPGEIGAKAMNCPNCGGQLTMTQAGKCEYCGSLVVLDDHGWALSELEPFNK